MSDRALHSLSRVLTICAVLLALSAFGVLLSAELSETPQADASTPSQPAPAFSASLHAAAHPDALSDAGTWKTFSSLLTGVLTLLALSLPLRRVRTGRNIPAGRRDQSGPPAFPNYLQLRERSRLSPRFWAWARAGTVIAVLIGIALLFFDPDMGLVLFWRLTIPVLPALFLLAPGLWRNVCPLAASNQLPRVLKFSRALTPPAWLREYGFVIGMGFFFLFASSRKWLFNGNGPATGALVIFALVSALLGGYLFKGKSGWCTSICPLYPVQRLYNQTPFVTVANAHCTPCVGCTKNCYDFMPGPAYLSDLEDNDPHYASYRKFFAAAMPGFVVAYFTAISPVDVGSLLAMYLQFAGSIVISVGVFYLLHTFLRVSVNKITAVYGATAFSLFYWFGLPGWLKTVEQLSGVELPAWLNAVAFAGVVILALTWVARTYRNERVYRADRAAKAIAAESIPVLTAAAPSAGAASPSITFLPGDTQIAVTAGATLLEVAESHKQPLTPGCRMGLCGADPVRVISGMEHLPPVSAEEKSTLDRLGLGGNCRLACMCKVSGPVVVSTNLTEPAATPIAPAIPTVTAPATAAVSAPKPPAAVPVVAAAPSPALAGQPAITFMPGNVRVPLAAGRTLLEIAEDCQQPIEAGCRMGMCGADPVVIVDGMENLPPVSAEEKSTLERLGLGGNCRLACMCRAKGPVTVSLQTKEAAVPPAAGQPIDYDPNLKSVVVIGNGIAGVTAADYVRRHHPDCEIHLIGRERHHLYNRMAITRLIYGRSAMTGLYLQSEAWYDERRITCWLNTHVTHINRGHRQVMLATGETLNYDRLILASGSSSFVPPIPGFGLDGTFVLREAEEAMEIRAYVQQHQCRTAVVAGGGLLGLEAAYALHKMGLTVWVLERGEWLLRRQLDAAAARLLKQQLEALGMTIVTGVETECLEGEGRVTGVTLKNGRRLACDVFLVAVGIQPNVELARAIGLEVNRGIVVDEKMRTSAPDIYAAGDVCEFDQQVPGLWPVAVEQAKVAALNVVGGDATYEAITPVTLLKVVGVDLTSIGRIAARPGRDIEIVIQDVQRQRYRKLVITEGRLSGAILLGYPLDAPIVTAAIKARLEVSDCLSDLRAGCWECLQGLLSNPPVPDQAAAAEKLRARIAALERLDQAAARGYRWPRPSADTSHPAEPQFHTRVFDFRKQPAELETAH